MVLSHKHRADERKSETYSTEKKIKDHLQPEDTLNDKEGDDSAAEKLKCLYLCTRQFARYEIFFVCYILVPV